MRPHRLSIANQVPRCQSILVEHAVELLKKSFAEKNCLDWGTWNAADVFTEISKHAFKPDVVTDQTSAHDPLNGYLPQGWTLEQWKTRRQSEPQAVIEAAKASMAVQVRAMLELQKRGAATLDYGNNIRQMAFETA